MKTTKIILLGYMGCGKTAVGEVLKNQLQTEFWDLDRYIERKLDTTIASIFQQKGELFLEQRKEKHWKSYSK